MVNPIHFLITFCLFLIATLVGCTGGDVKVSSLGLSLEKVSLKQNESQNDFLEINKESKLLRFKLVCTENYSSVELRNKDSQEWLKGTSVDCSQADTFFSIDLKSLAIQLEEGKLNAVEFRFVSEKGFSDPISKNIVISQYVPTTATVVVQDFSGYINTLDINLTVTANYSYKSGESHGPSEAYITDIAGCGSGGTWQMYRADLSWTMKKSNDTNIVYVKFRDAGLSESDCVSASTFHDNVGPVASQLTFLAFPSPNLTNTDLINLSLLSNGDPYEMKISSSPICIGGDWETYATQKNSFPVATLNSMNQISVKFRDRAHNESSCLSANFTHDTTPPAIPTMTIIHGTNPGQLATPGFQISGLSVGDQFELYGEGTCTTPLKIQTAASTSDFYFASLSTDGTYQYYTRIRDAATNWLECQGPLFTYKLDRVAPTATSSGHPTTVSNIATWTETFDGTDVYEYKFKIGPAPSTTCSDKATGYSAWILKSTTSTANMDITSYVDGNVTLCVYGRDQALNEQSAPTSYTWTKNTSSIQASFLATSLPSIVSNTTTLAVRVEGYLIDQYKFKVGLAASTDCTQAAGYSASWTNVSTLITSSVSGFPNASVVRICVYGRNSTSLTEQPLSLETKYDFTRDTQPARVISIDFPPAGDYLIGDDLIIGLNFDEDIVVDPTVTGTRAIDVKLNGGAVSKAPVYYRKVSNTKLEFLYKIVSGDAGNFGHSNQLSMPTTGFIKDKAGNALNTASGSVTANLGSSTVQVFNQLPTLSIAWAGNEFFEESTGQVSFVATLSSAISTNLDFSYFVEAYSLDGVTKETWNFSDSIPAGQTSKTVTVTGINNALTDGTRGIAIDLRKINHGIYGTKTLTGAILDDELKTFSGTVVDVALGTNDACFYTSLGHVYCYGIGTYGELGQGTASESRSIPQRLTSLSGVTQLYALNNSQNYYCAKASDGIYCWGYSAEYATGTGSTTAQTTPYKVSGVGANPSLFPLTDFQVTCSKDSVAGTKCWGENASGLAGTGSTLSNITTPTSVLASINDARKFFETQGATISSTARCALINDGNNADGSPALCWGDGANGLSGIGTVLNRTPTLLMAAQVIDIAPVNRGFCAWGDFNTNKSGYEVACWGGGVVTSYILGYTATVNYTPQEITGFDNTDKFHFSTAYACAVGNYDAGVTGLEIMCWGQNSAGRLGNGTASTSSTVPGAPLGFSISGVDDIKLGTNAACGKKTDGTLWCWGNGFTTSPTQQVTAGFTDFYVGVSYVLVKTASNGLQCYGVCTSYVKGNLPVSGVTKVVVNENGTQYCFIASGALTCSGSYNSPRFGLGTLALTEATQTYSSSQLVKIIDENFLCFDFTSTIFHCRGFSQYSLGKAGSAFTSLMESKIPTSAKKVSVANYATGYVDSLDNLIQFTGNSASNMSTFGVSPNTVGVLNIKGFSQAFLNIFADSFFPYTTAVLSGKQMTVLNHASAQNNASSHYCYPLAGGSIRCAAGLGGSGYTSGQLGDNNSATGTLNVLRTPLVDAAQELTDVAETATGGNRSCARTTANELYCWGANIDSGGLSNAVMARLMLVGVTKVKMDTNGRIFIKKSDNKLYVAPSNTITFIEKFSSVSDFWGSPEGICVKKLDNHFYCLPENGFDLSIFGRFFDKMPYPVY